MTRMRFLEYLPSLPTRRQMVITAVSIGSIALLGWLLKLWFTTQYELAGHRAAPHGVVFVDKHDLIATACADLHLYLFSATDGTPLRRIGGHTKRLTSISTFKDADCVATGSADGRVKIWSLPRGIEERSIVAHKGVVLAVRYSQDGSRLASVGNDQMIRVWDPESGQMVVEIKCAEPNGCLAMNLNGSLVAAGGSEDDLIVWSVSSGSEVARLRGDMPATSSCFSPDGASLAVGREDGALEMWSTSSWERQEEWHEHKGIISDVAFSTDGRTLFTASGDRTIGVWNLEVGFRIGVITGHPKQVLSVAASSSGAIASGGYGPYARLWTDPLAAVE